MIAAIKKLFGVYEENREYWVYTKKIQVPPEFRATGIGKKKLGRKMYYWRKNGTFESKVILDKHYNLLDGYTTVYIAENAGIEKIPAYFVKDPDAYKAQKEQEYRAKKNIH